MTGFRWLVARVALVTLAVGASGCSRKPEQQQLIVGVARLPERIAPLSVQRSAEERLLVGLLFGGLFRVASDTSGAVATPVLAAGLPLPVDQSLLTFEISLNGAAAAAAGVTTYDVVASWHTLLLSANEYGRRALLAALVRRLDRTGLKSIRVSLSRPAVPEDVALLFSFPVVPGLADGSHLGKLMHPDSVVSDGAVRDVLAGVRGSGLYRLVGALAAGLPMVVLRNRAGSREVVLRALSDSAAQAVALTKGEVDVLADPGEVAVREPPRGFHVVPDGDTTELILLRLARRAGRSDAAWPSLDVALPTSGAASPCATSELSTELFWVVTAEPNAVVERVVSGVRGRLRCAGLKLRLVRRTNPAVAPTGLPYDAVLLRLGDPSTDVPLVAAWLQRFDLSNSGTAHGSLDQWLRTPSSGARRRISAVLLQRLRDSHQLSLLERRPSVRLIRNGLTLSGW